MKSAQVWATVVEETDNFDFDGLPYKREKGGGKWTANSKILPRPEIFKLKKFLNQKSFSI